jgi:alpha-tubulin suppressor-like RCC1 family protein
VTLARKVTQIVASHFDTCALTDDHEVYCWGENLRGETGAPNPAADRGIRTAWTPYHAALASGARQLAAAFSTLCAVKLDGKIVCWGDLTDKLGPAFDTATQGEVPDIGDATAVAVGASHACAIRQDGALWCWGTGAGGALGDGRGSDAWQPRPVSLPGRAVQVVSGLRFRGSPATAWRYARCPAASAGRSSDLRTPGCAAAGSDETAGRRDACSRGPRSIILSKFSQLRP